jgi:hypothetical protein
MLKYTTFGELLTGENLADEAWFHIFPSSGDRLRYYQQKWATGGTSDMAGETRYQTKRNFTGAKRVFMLLPLDRREHYVFVGAYDITSDERPKIPDPTGVGECFYIENEFNPSILPECLGRLVVEWRRPVRYRYLKAETAGADLALVALRERAFGEADLAFPGFQDFHMTFAELVAHSRRPLVAWKAALSNVAGVYAITDTEHGVTYIGSAYGDEGIWSRWMGYAATQHNGNKQLRAHVEQHGTQSLQFSVLLTMDLRSTADEVIARESFFKRALGTRVFGLNSN